MNLVMELDRSNRAVSIAMADHNDAKAEKSKMIYDAIDGSGGFYRGHAKDPDCRFRP